MFRDAFTILDTADVGRLSAFYVDRLGFEHGYRWPDHGEAIFRVVSLGPFSLGSRRLNRCGRQGGPRFGSTRTISIERSGGFAAME
jgi:hypothetical protein